MATEIADSDSESEILVDQIEIEPTVPSADSSCLKDIHLTTSPLDVDLDRLIDPTQRLSDLGPSQKPLLSRGTGSTEKILRELDKGRKPLSSSNTDGSLNNDGATFTPDMNDSSPLVSRKRGQSAIDISSTDLEGEPNKKKRPKTYSTKLKNANSHSTDLFADITLCREQHTAPESEGTNSNASIVAMEASFEAPVPRERDRPRRVISLLKPAITETNAYFSTSTSSMGGYQSLNLDFRGSGQRLDINANPFGALSQASIHEDSAPLKTGTADPYDNTDQTDKVIIDDQTSSFFQVQRDMMTSPSQPAEFASLEVIDPRTLMQDGIGEPPEQALGMPSKRRKTDTVGSRTTASPAPGSSRRAASMSVEPVASDGPQPKKRGRKPKSSKPAASSPAPEAGPTDEFHTMDPPPSRTKRSRPGQIDALSQVSETSETMSSTKRKRKNTKAEEIREQSSPAKNPSSELNLSDEHAIGLPKEQYKPRPSRSRSKRSVDEEIAALEPPTTDKHGDESDTVQVADIEALKPVKGKGKGKKNKVKRAKTSGIALKKSEPMLSDGEEDVLFMEEKPAAVKLDLPPDLDVLKKEDGTKNVGDGEKEDSEDEVKTRTHATKLSVTIEIPPPRPASPVAETLSLPEPKKRGRKPKNPTPMAPAPEVLADPDENNPAIHTTSPKVPSNTTIRQPLQDKDANSTTTTIPHPPSQSNPTGKENTTPSPSKTTPHSPLKTSSSIATTTKIRYRVGLSKRHSIPGLLRRVDRTKKAPTKVATTVKERKIKVGEGGEDEDEGDGDGDGSGRAQLGLRDRNGELIEWEF